MTPSIDGVLVVDKPEGLTSHDVVAAVRRRLPKGTKVGHTGTLDPFATGVLPVVIGKATRLSQFLTGVRKCYVAGVTFGTATDSGDRTGRVIATGAPSAGAGLTPAVIADALGRFIGTHPQVPPAHSAKKVEGERAYALARRGESVTLPPVTVTAYALGLETWDAATQTATVTLEVSAGYYVRSLARDLGQAVGVPAHLSSLRRTASGDFTLVQAHDLAALVQAPADRILEWRVPMAALLPDLPALPLHAAQLAAVVHGQPFALTPDQQMPREADRDPARIRLLDERGELVALARPSGPPPHLLHADLVLR